MASNERDGIASPLETNGSVYLYNHRESQKEGTPLELSLKGLAFDLSASSIKSLNLHFPS